METIILKVNAKRPDPNKIRAAASIIRGGGLVAFPTETVYGLGANALDPKAVKRIFKAKGRPTDNPMIVHVASIRDAKKVVRAFTPKAEMLAKTFWPGPLTLVLKKSNSVPDAVTAGMDTVAVRMPAHKTALALISECGAPIAAPSANISGRPSPTQARHVKADLNGKIEAIIDGGSTRIGVESTVVDMTSKTPTVLRPGGVTVEELRRVLGKVDVYTPTKSGKPRSPGMKYRHYAPKAELILVEGKKEAFKEKARKLARKYQASGKKVGVIETSASSLEQDARELYSRLRSFDESGTDVIIAQAPGESGLGLAIKNRLKKAATKVVTAGE